MAHTCKKFICAECQQPTTQLHSLPADLQNILSGYRKPLPHLEIEEEEKHKRVEYYIWCGDHIKYHHTITLSCVKHKHADWAEILKSLRNFPQKQYIRSYPYTYEPASNILIPGIEIREVCKKETDSVIRYIHLHNDYENHGHYYSLKYLPAFTAMLADIEKRLEA